MGLAGHDASGEPLEVVAFENPELIVHSPRAFAPGQPMTVTIALDPALQVALQNVSGKAPMLANQPAWLVLGMRANLR